MTVTPNLNIPYLQAAQAQKHITHNEAIRALDALVQLSVIGKAAQPPDNPPDGARYIVSAPASGLWLGKETYIAAWQDHSWFFYPPHKGWLAWGDQEASLLVWNGLAWVAVTSDNGSNGGSGGGSLAAAIMPNLLINADMSVNQRGFAGGALAAGTYGHDRWKAGDLGANYSDASGIINLTSGSIVQTLENPGLAGQSVTISAYHLSGGNLSVSIGGVSATLLAQGGTTSVSLDLPSSANGHLSMRLSPASNPVSFKNLKLEIGTKATTYIKPHWQQELALCQRYFLSLSGSFFMEAYLAGGGYAYQHAVFPVTMRTNPTVSYNSIQEFGILNKDITATAQQMDYYMQRQTGSDGRTYLRFTDISFEAEL